MARRFLPAVAALVMAVNVSVVSGCSTASRLPRALQHSGMSGAARQQLSPAASASRPDKVLLVVEENHGPAATKAGMPYLRRLGRKYGETTNYRAITHPSLPNYLALVGGSTFAVHDDAYPSAHPVRGPSVFDQAIATGKTAKTYAESMAGNCTLTSSGRYAVKHNPWAYFRGHASRTNCMRRDVPAGTTSSGALRRDIGDGRLPTVGMLIPNLCDDAHDCPLSTADAWLHRWMTVVKHGPDWTSGRLAVVITFDENEGTSPNTVLTTVLSKATRHVVSATRYTHYSWTRYADQLIGAPALRNAAKARSLRKHFHI